jgi:hypothetical protein
MFQEPSAIADKFRNYFHCDEGTYKLKALWKKGPTRGIVKWILDDIDTGLMQDGYSADVETNAVIESTIVIPFSGAHKLEGLTTGKNALATDYRIALTKIWFEMV